MGLATAALVAREGAPLGLVTPIVFGGSAVLGAAVAAWAARVPCLPSPLRLAAAGRSSRLPVAAAGSGAIPTVLASVLAVLLLLVATAWATSRAHAATLGA